MLSICSMQYGISIEFLQQDTHNNGYSNLRAYPLIKLRSNKLSKDHLLRIQDEIQMLIIRKFSPKSIIEKNPICLSSDAMLSSILDTLSTKNAKKEVTKWFRG